ncbi:protein involved in polysaccharide export with SLBB domain [Flavobacterium sp. 103]|uniref:SLBB domain-containing protein n=1 Tax=Flavobacterium sp. 103 TaxID=2135624 RepID=UPI000D5CC8F5|nr:SLBB domain-containing protein [Flavobacterium sp. 103]PVX46578.1 protein involved in polysaccharide export with SLBB domain [Flavobacterium sp. 103]
MKKIITAIVLLVALFQSSSLMAQDIIKGNDLSTVRVDYLSDGDIAKIKSQLQSNNVSIDQAESMALSKGMSATEFAKLKKRLALPEAAKATTDKKTTKKKSKDSDSEDEQDDSEDAQRKQEKIENKKVKDSLNSLVFGSELFDNPTLNFQPNLKLATPVNYVLGPGDELQVSVNGVQEFDDNVPVTVEGKVNIQYVGQISVSGMTIEAATQKIKGAIARIYSTVRSGQSQVSVSLSRIRTIKVTIIGSRQPGNYSISSLATVYNALFLGGGPGKNGSYRNIELIRNNKVYKNIDIYRFLVSGNQSDNVGLKDNDVIRIPAYINRVTVEGEVKRPGIFEMKKGEHFSDLLNFASGFNEFAYTASVNVLQKTGKEFKVADIQAAQYGSYTPLNGDVYRVSKILNRFENRIIIEGAVFRPDTYSFYEGMRFSDLVRQAEGLKEDAYKKRAIIVRLKSDLTTEIVNVNLEKALSGDMDADIALRKEDKVTVYSILDFREEYKITIDGEVKMPGVYDYHDRLTLNDLLIEAGGLKGSASKHVEVARMIKSDTINDSDPNRSTLFNLEITAESNEQIKNFVLEPYDVVNVRRMAVFEKPEMVKITGAVAYTGKYVLASKKEKIYDVIQRAGGLTSVADLDGVKIKRPIKGKQIEDLENVSMNVSSKISDIESEQLKTGDKNNGSGVKSDTIQNKLAKKLLEEKKYATIPVDWRKIIKDPSNNTNVTLLPGDEIEVATYNESVKITGNVLLTSEIPYTKGRSFNYYLDAVGGLDARGWKKKAYVIYPNGKAAVSNSFLLVFRTYPKVLPGSQIVVPEKPLTKKMTTGEWVSIGSIIASLSLLIVTAFK